MLSSLYVVIYIFVIVECFMVAKVMIIFEMIEGTSLKNKSACSHEHALLYNSTFKILYVIVFTNSHTND